MDTQRLRFTPRVIAQMLIVVVFIPLLPLWITRRWQWWEAWAFAGISIAGFAASRLLVARRHPGLLAERARFMQHDDATAWDKVIAPVVGLGGGLIPLVAGLDVLFGWSPQFSLALKVAALMMIVAGYGLGTYAMLENQFFSGLVRLQTDRGHRVVSGGPYRWLRHPGYVGALLAFLGTPLLLDSRWAFLPAILIAIVMIVRTALEDRFLQAELPGYRDYARRVRYRLLPGVW